MEKEFEEIRFTGQSTPLKSNQIDNLNKVLKQVITQGEINQVYPEGYDNTKWESAREILIRLKTQLAETTAITGDQVASLLNQIGPDFLTANLARVIDLKAEQGSASRNYPNSNPWGAL